MRPRPVDPGTGRRGGDTDRQHGCGGDARDEEETEEESYDRASHLPLRRGVSATPSGPVEDAVIGGTARDERSEGAFPDPIAASGLPDEQT
jgi:hypothetical protein